MEKLLTTAEVCEILKIHSNTLGRYIRRGWVRPARVGNQHRFRVKQVEQLIDKLEK